MVTRAKATEIGLGMAGYAKKEVILMTKFSPVPYSDEILKKTKITYDKNKTLWRYDSLEGIWKPNAEQHLRTLIRVNLLGDEQQKKNYVEEIISHIKDVTFNEDFKIDDNPSLIGFENGVFNLDRGVFQKFEPDFKLTNKIKIKINQEIKVCPAIDKFFEDCVGKNFKCLLYDLFAYCLFRRYPYPKIFFIYGPANTGKSKLIQLLELFLGKLNRCSIEPQEIQKDQYATSQMLYKMANIVSDINYDALDNISQVKKITGEDSIKIRNMYREPYDARVFAKQIFSTNKLPAVKEKTKAWYKRVYPLEFSNIVTSDKEDPFLIDKLTIEKELQGLAYQCLEHLKELKKSNFVFSYDIDQNEMQKVYEQLSNPILMFIEQECGIVKGEFIYQFEFKERLKVWLQTNHFAPVSNSEINSFMREHYTDSNRKSFNGEKIYRVWTGIKWEKGSHNPLISNQFNHFNHVLEKVYIDRKKFQEPCKSVKLVRSEKEAKIPENCNLN